ncbi:hypothetical protein GCM10011589_20840 [Modestobacter marinus]|uniref:Uncharacterized protein n=1 Tax=Modestobacter marinus TaxID=477641 RepID=A0ABQ2FXW3_9ACTN|nr:hypothetical protein GCM10011589_20840 [Modestobacter marinus]
MPAAARPSVPGAPVRQLVVPEGVVLEEAMHPWHQPAVSPTLPLRGLQASSETASVTIGTPWLPL